MAIHSSSSKIKKIKKKAEAVDTHNFEGSLAYIENIKPVIYIARPFIKNKAREIKQTNKNHFP